MKPPAPVEPPHEGGRPSRGRRGFRPGCGDHILARPLPSSARREPGMSIEDRQLPRRVGAATSPCAWLNPLAGAHSPGVPRPCWCHAPKRPGAGRSPAGRVRGMRNKRKKRRKVLALTFTRFFRLIRPSSTTDSAAGITRSLTAEATNPAHSEAQERCVIPKRGTETVRA